MFLYCFEAFIVIFWLTLKAANSSQFLLFHLFTFFTSTVHVINSYLTFYRVTDRTKTRNWKGDFYLVLNLFEKKQTFSCLNLALFIVKQWLTSLPVWTFSGEAYVLAQLAADAPDEDDQQFWHSGVSFHNHLPHGGFPYEDQKDEKSSQHIDATNYA